MNPTYRKFGVALLAMLLAFPLLAAGKRRAVGHPNTPATDSGVRGVVLDSVTGQPVPVAGVSVEGTTKTDTTDAQGRFEMKNVPAGPRTLVVTRSGYETKRIAINVVPAGVVAEVRLVSLPTISVRMTNGTTYKVDTETAEFAYLAPFSGYSRTEYARLCRTGAEFHPTREEIRKIVGPAVPVTEASCCSTGPVLKVNVELKNGSKSDAFFEDSCVGYPIDFIGRDHATGQFVYLRFTDIAEIVFP